MKAISTVSTFLSIAALALTVGACGSNNNNNPAPGVAAPITTCVYTQVGMLPQGSCPAGQGQIITAQAGYTAGQCVLVTANNGGVGAYPTTGAYPGYNTGYGYGNTGYGYGNTGYGNTGYGTTGLDGGQCAGQTGVNGINNGQCVQTQFGCLQQCPSQPGSLLYNGNCAPYSYFGVQGNINTGLPGAAPIPPYGYNNYGPYAPGYYTGYLPGGGGNFGGYYYRGI
jgi:hypothetical protein